HTRSDRDWSSDVCSSDLLGPADNVGARLIESANAGALVETSEQVEQVLSRWLEEFRTTGTLATGIDAQRVRVFERRALTGQLARSEERRVGKEGRTRRAR